jgi:predicted nucleotidyltransferase
MTEVAACRPPTLDELRARRDEILEIAARHGVFDIRVFGSVARGDCRNRRKAASSRARSY